MAWPHFSPEPSACRVFCALGGACGYGGGREQVCVLCVRVCARVYVYVCAHVYVYVCARVHV